jgi:hypothetical protein
MIKSMKAKQLRVQLEELDSALVPGSSQGSATPMAKKINEGSDRYFGYPPA